MVRSIGSALAAVGCVALVVFANGPAFAISDYPPAPCSTTFNCWTGPGWYQEYGDDEGGAIYAGPFANRAECERYLPPDDDRYEYTCFEYLTQPSEDVRP